MTREEYLNELNKAFGDFKFFPEGHYYEYKGQRVGISVTRLIEQYTNEFDSEGMAQKKSKELNITPEELLRQWKYKNDFSKAKGHTIHEFSQSLWSGEEWVYDSFDNSKEYNEVIEKLKQQAINYYNDYKDKYEFVAAEVIVGDETTDCASAIDLLLRNKITGELLLVDIKTNSYIRGYNKKAFKNPMKVPLHNLNDDAYNHYCIQLSIYKKWLIELAKLKVSEMHIVYFSENIENYEIVKVNYLKSEVERILNLRKKDRNMGKCIPILIIGKSGSGKSTSLRNAFLY